MQIGVDAGESVDEVCLDGKPSIYSVIHGVRCDISSAAVAVNCVRRVIAAAPGLETMAVLAIVSDG